VPAADPEQDAGSRQELAAELGEAGALPAAERPRPGGRGFVDELERLARLRDADALTDEEFTAAKARLLSERRG
jgi:hypothetical protein